MAKRDINPLRPKTAKKVQDDEDASRSIRDTAKRPSRDAGDEKTPSDKGNSSSDGDTGAGAAAEVSTTSPLRDVGLSGIDSATLSGIDRLAGTLDSRIAESMPTSAVSSEAASSVRDDVAQSAGATESGEVAANFGGGASSPALSELIGMGTWAQTGQGSDTTSSTVSAYDEQFAELARDYLNNTGRYDSDEVANMSHEELNEVLNGEADRALLGYEGPMDNETIRAWFVAENKGMEENSIREYLIGLGYDPGEVAMMDSETLRLYLFAEAEVAIAGGEAGPPDGDGTGGHSGGSISLSDTESGKTQMGDEGSGSGDSSNSSSSESDSGSDSDSDDDDDDDDDDDNDSGDTTTQTDTGTDSEESEGNSEGSGAAPESSTPNPEHDSYNEADKAAFLATKLGAESRGQDMDAIDGAIGGGLIVGDGEDPGARAAWFASDMSAGERALAAESVGMAKGGGHTDPVDDSAGGTSDLDVTRLPNYGLIDPADSSTPGGTPVDPITGAPSAPPVGGVRSDADTGEGEGEGDDSAVGFAGADLIGSAGSTGLTGMAAGSNLFRGMEDLNAESLDVDRVDVDDLDLGT